MDNKDVISINLGELAHFTTWVIFGLGCISLGALHLA